MLSKITTSLEDRLWRDVDRSGDGCWEWQAAKITNGYGHFQFQKIHYYAHRTAWLVANGSIPTGLHVLHTCDNRACCRPDHMFLGTQADNMRDMIAKGRKTRGEQSPNSKLTEDDVRYIRAMYPAKQMKQLAAQYNVSTGAIFAVIHRVNWRHVE